MLETHSKSTVAVVICTYNGEQHLQAQLDTLATQSWPIALRVFDDSSSDATTTILQNNAERFDLQVHANEQNLGYVQNFESAINHALQEGFDYIALCDQDDLWQSDRIEKGMQALLAKEQTLGSSTALLCHSDLKMINSTEAEVQASFLAYRQYSTSQSKSLPTALGQSGVMGNTVLMNASLAARALPFPENLHVHDYWLGLVAELFGHRLLLNEALVSYRIHDRNASNSSDDIKFGLQKLMQNKSWQGFVRRDYRLPFMEDSRAQAVKTLLTDTKHNVELSDEQKRIIELFCEYLELKTGRVSLFIRMLKAGFYKKGVRHRLRVAYSTLLTQRYSKNQ